MKALAFLFVLVTLISFLNMATVASNHEGKQNSFSDLFAWNKPMLAGRSKSSKELSRLKEISNIIPRNGFFYGMNPNHMKAMLMVRDLFTGSSSSDDLIATAAGLRDRGEINPHAWLRAVVSESIHRRDMQRLRLPPIMEVMPSLFIPGAVLDAVGKSINRKTRDDSCPLIDGNIGRDNGQENRLWYFREDIMVNSFHWHYHLAHPVTGERGKQDRLGELFFFIHHELLARYHSERLSVGLPPVKSFNFTAAGTPCPEAYNPHMRDGNSGRDWSPRPIGVPVADVNISSDVIHDRPFQIKLEARAAQLGKIEEGIREGFLLDRNNVQLNLKTDEGITILGNTLEANNFSADPERYGADGVHNEGHIVISLVQDPRNDKKIPPGVMGDTATSMRDVIFYAYHNFADDVFAQYKKTLPAYQRQEGSWPLLLEGISVQKLNVISADLPTNVLSTFWASKRIDVSRGLDFQSVTRGEPMWICAKHLDHQEFVYELNIERKEIATDTDTATVRIFLGPRFDLKGEKYTLERQRRLMFMLDSFTIPLKFGMNNISRHSSQTPLTIDFPQVSDDLKATENPRPFCGCGWPRHLLIPKGNRAGLVMDLFAIVTDARHDSVKQDDGGSDSESDMGCRPAYIYCGLMGKKYPDARPMGYPFDRTLYLSEDSSTTVSLEDLVREIPNSGHASVSIIHRSESESMENFTDSTSTS